MKHGATGREAAGKHEDRLPLPGTSKKKGEYGARLRSACGVTRRTGIKNVNQPVSQTTKQSTNQPINQSTNQSVSESINHPTNQPIAVFMYKTQHKVLDRHPPNK